MSPEAYVQLQVQLGVLAKVVADMPLAEFLAAIAHSETVGPLLDPTLYRSASAGLARVKRIAEAAHAFQHEVMELNREEQRRAAVRL